MLNATKLTVLAAATLAAIGIISIVPSTPARAASPRQPVVEAVHMSSTWTVPTAEEKVITTSEVVIVASKVKKHTKVYTCGEFEALANDSVQKVRRCEWK